MVKEKINLFWFRRDLRLFDNQALYHALNSGFKVLPIFIFDKQILKHFPDSNNKAVSFIYSALKKMNEELLPLNKSLNIFYGNVEEILRKLLSDYDVEAVYVNTDYEPNAISRDKHVRKTLQEQGVSFYEFHDQIIMSPGSVLKSDGTPYTIFTPFSKAWKQKINFDAFKIYESEALKSNFVESQIVSLFSLKDIGYQYDASIYHDFILDDEILLNYEYTRDFPFITHGTSKVSPHLRFGTISIRNLAKKAKELNEKYLNELIWREFFMHIMWHFPQVVNHSFKKKYDAIEWENNEHFFELWIEGKTGYPLVDAGMRELNATGFMHGRVRMVVSSFLCKNLLIDWHWGEAYFAQKLLDYELSSNNGNWQWAAGSGCDAVPYFRLFNPILQQQRFDPKFEYIRKWVHEFQSDEYQNNKIIDLDFSKQKCLETYNRALKQ